MNLTRCNHGHFYDMDKFDTCPHCKNGGADSEKTSPLGESAQATSISAFDGGAGDVTVPFNEFSVAQPTPKHAVADVAEPATPPVTPVTPVVPPINPVTPGQGYGYTAEAPTEPLSENSFGGQVYSGQIAPTPISVPPYSDDVTGKSTSDLASAVTNAMSSRVEPADEGKTIGFYSDVMAEQNVSIEPVVGWLVCIKGDAFGKSFTLKSGKNFIGRDRKMDVALVGDKSVSRQCHAIILYDPKSRMFLVQPGTSRELFYLNDKVVLGVEAVQSNDVLSIGKTDLMFIPLCSAQFSWEEQIEKINAEVEK